MHDIARICSAGWEDASVAKKSSVPSMFSEADLRAWRGFLRVHASVTRELSEAMETTVQLSLAEYEVLLKLATSEDGTLPMSKLGTRSYLTLSSSGLSRLVDRLRRRSLVTREPCVDGDRRSALVAITSDGRALWEKAAAGHRQRVDEQFLSRLTRSEVKQLGELWDRLLDEN